MFYKMSDPSFLQLTIHVTMRWPQNYIVDIDECVGEGHIIKIVNYSFIIVNK